MSYGEALVSIFSPGLVVILTIIVMIVWLGITIHSFIDEWSLGYKVRGLLAALTPVVIVLGVALVIFLVDNTLPGDWTPYG